MAELFTTEEIGHALEDTGGVPVTYGGVSTWGHFDHVPDEFGVDGGVGVSVPSVVIPSDALPGICLDDGAGTLEGVNESIQVGDYVWTVRKIVHGRSHREIEVFLSNRSAP